MESPRPFEPNENGNVARRLVGCFIASIRFVAHQLTTSDQSPHEGRLRGSAMPSEYINIPDYPPSHDDTI